mgnify:CR=1 FL=1
MKKYGKWIAVALLLSLVFSAVAVNYHKNGAERQNRLSLIYIPKVVDSRNDFWTSLIQGVQMSAQEANVDIEIMAPEEENDVEGQNRILKQAILKNPDAILISPSSFTESNSLLQEARDQGYGSHLLTLIQKKVFRRSQLPQTMWRQEKNLGNLRLLC